LYGANAANILADPNGVDHLKCSKAGSKPGPIDNLKPIVGIKATVMENLIPLGFEMLCS